MFSHPTVSYPIIHPSTSYTWLVHPSYLKLPRPTTYPILPHPSSSYTGLFNLIVPYHTSYHSLLPHPPTPFFVLHWSVQPSFLMLPRPTTTFVQPSYLSVPSLAYIPLVYPHPTSYHDLLCPTLDCSAIPRIFRVLLLSFGVVHALRTFSNLAQLARQLPRLHSLSLSLSS